MIGIAEPHQAVAARADFHFEEHRQSIFKRVDRLFAGLLLFQWVACMALARWITPRAWDGMSSHVHLHYWAAVLLVGVIVTFPVILALRRPGEALTRHSIAIAQMLTSALLIHLTGGRIETHFHVFGSLAFLAFYRDWRVLVSASTVVALDHWARGVFWPESVYGVAVASSWRWLEHAGWVVFEDIFLTLACIQGVKEMRDIAGRRAQIESAHELVEAEIQKRTCELRASEERFRSLSACSPIGIFQTDADGRCTYTNPRWQEIFGLTAEQGLGNGWSQGVHVEDRVWLMEQWSRAVGEEREFAGEFRVATSDGAVRWVYGRAAKVAPSVDRRLGYVGTIEEITERKRVEVELREKNDALENAVEGISRLDTEGRYVSMNSAYAGMLGYKPEELLGQSWELTVHEGDRDSARKTYEQMLNGGRAEVDTRGICKNGSVLHKRVSMIKAFDREKRFIGHYCFTKDITEHKVLEEQLRQSQKIEAVGRLAGGVAHDFNNLLTVILGYSQMLSKKVGHDESLRADVNEIKGAGNRAAALTRQLLAFSRRQMLVPSVLALDDLVGNMDKMLRRLIGEHIDLMTVATPGLGRVKADPGQLEQVIMNLVVNARDAMPSGGKLTLETKNVAIDEEYAARHPGLKPGRYVMLGVSDNGMGMDEKTQNRIFEPFFTTKKRGEGTGLGLAMVYGIVKQSDGYVQVYSQVGHGTTFKIYLPRLEQALEEAETPKPEGARTGRETILLVEDEEAVRRLAFQVLAAAGYTVLDARDCDDALAISRRHTGPIDLLLTDVVMPLMSGPQLAQAVVSARHMRVLFMSGYTDNAISHQGILEAGAAFLQKPFLMDDLLHKVRDVLDAPAHSLPSGLTEGVAS